MAANLSKNSVTRRSFSHLSLLDGEPHLAAADGQELGSDALLAPEHEARHRIRRRRRRSADASARPERLVDDRALALGVLQLLAVTVRDASRVHRQGLDDRVVAAAIQGPEWI